MMTERTRHYLLLDLASAPDVLARLLADTSDPAVYDRRPDPDRFTLREMVAHLADWEAVFLDRLSKTRDEENATLQGLDEGQVAIDHDYAHAAPPECLARYKAGRVKIVTLLHGLAPEQWGRVGRHTEIGPITLGRTDGLDGRPRRLSPAADTGMAGRRRGLNGNGLLAWLAP